ncbi:P22 phage major capsid protein family protein [Streptomyces cylindrosporus]|uniref:Phage capsid protein n=1 Tax=Streptomyces cylindrosporus TaxID=2927583 RepID=A0ABS9Y1C6_9ACTN|nr:P22 phage major capsid protein family protein [Streptomyces cylindrosporus]MCI3271018.1 phage capsid protein [Streptomyces cylindrosporus]
MAVDTFIPEVWSADLLVALRGAQVFGQAGVINRNYEGEISSYGDTVHIGSLGRPTISTYTKNSTSIDPQTLTTTDQTLLIDQSKYFAFEVDDVDARQARDGGRLLTQSADEAAFGVADVVDLFLASLMTTNAGNVVTAGDAATPDAAYKIVLALKLKLDKAKVPTSGRFIIISPEFYALILQDNRFIDAAAYGSNTALINGEVGRILGFQVMTSMNLPQGTAGTAPEVSNFVVAGHGMATTFAEQISKVEAYRPQSSFSDAIKGLHLYGAKVVRPEALAVMDVDVTTGLPT